LIEPNYHDYFAGQLDLVGRGDLASEVYFLEEKWALDPDLIRANMQWLRAVRNPVLCLCSNCMDIESAMSRAQDIWALGEFFVLDWDAALINSANRCRWPYFYLEQRRLQSAQDCQPRLHRVSMLSGRVRQHRLAAWQAVHDIIDPRDIIVINALGIGDYDADPGDVALPWSYPPGLEYPDQTLGAVHDTTSTDHPAYRACVNVTGESHGSRPGIFVTEKTWKAITAHCIPLNTGCQGMTSYLQGLGFHDHGLDLGDDVTSVRSLFARQDVWQFYQSCRDIVDRDAARFWSDELLDHLCSDTIARLESWINR
jgi:hypothetical protein